MLQSKRNLEGYLLIDHRASPGTPQVPEGRILEAPTITCSHCNAVVILNPMRTRPRNYCAKCDHYVCDKAGCIVGCNPFMKQVDEFEKTETSAPIIVPGGG